MEEDLIQCVRNYPVLWDPTVKDYRNHQARKDAWDIIGQYIGSSDCKRRWVNIRDQYKKCLNKRKTKIGKRKYKFEHSLQFLLPYIQERDTTNNIESDNIESDGNSEQGQSEAETDPPKSDIKKFEIDQTETKFNDILITQPPFKLSPSAKILEENALLSAPTSPSPPQQTFPLPPPVSSSQTKSRPTQQFIRKRHIKICNRHTMALRRTRAQPTSCSKIIETNENIQKDIHPIDAFFNGLAPTVKQFSRYYQHVAKGKIFAVVQELEMEQMTF